MTDADGVVIAASPRLREALGAGDLEGRRLTDSLGALGALSADELLALARRPEQRWARSADARADVTVTVEDRLDDPDLRAMVWTVERTSVGSSPCARVEQALDALVQRVARLEEELTARVRTQEVGWTREVNEPAIMDLLSEREREIVRHTLRGEGTEAIARAIHLSPSTVRDHLSSIYRKLGIQGRNELLVRYRDRFAEEVEHAD